MTAVLLVLDCQPISKVSCSSAAGKNAKCRSDKKITVLGCRSSVRTFPANNHFRHSLLHLFKIITKRVLLWRCEGLPRGTFELLRDLHAVRYSENGRETVIDSFFLERNRWFHHEKEPSISWFHNSIGTGKNPHSTIPQVT